MYICENNKYCNIEMPSPNNNITKYHQGLPLYNIIRIVIYNLC